MQEGKEEQNKNGACPYGGPRGRALGAVLSSARPLLALHGDAATKRSATAFEAGAAVWRLVVAAAGAFAKRRVTVAGRGTASGLVLVAAIAETEHLLAVVRLGEAPGAATIFPKHPHVEGRITVCYLLSTALVFP